jgi:hypothetical protein
LPGNASGEAPARLSPQLAPGPDNPPADGPAAPTDPELARVAASWYELPPHIKAAVLALVEAARPPVANFAAAFAAAFDRLDRQAGGHNRVSLVALRQALPLDRAAFDTGLLQLRRAGRFTCSAAEGRHGLTAQERAAGITEDRALLLYASRVT